MSEKGKKRNVVSKMIRIDGEMLRRAIYDRDLVPTNMSKEMGMNNSYVSHCIGEGSISPGSARMLEVMFGIKPEEYFYKEPEPEPQNEAVAETVQKVNEALHLGDDFWIRLCRTINVAVYEAVHKAWNEPYKPGSEGQNAGN